jgi:predicted RNA-binding Zn ribbon-like protein
VVRRLAPDRGPVQPGGREPAPGTLELVQAFINTHYDLVHNHGAEVLSSPVALRDWLSGRGLLDPRAPVAAADLRRGLGLREGLRSLVRGGSEAEPRGGSAPRALSELNADAAGAAVEVRFYGEGPVFVAARGAGIEGALGVILASAAQAMLDGSWSRLKVCPGRDCGWAFYDHSRNRTGRWCSMSVCGGRAKARSLYRRRRGTD